MEQVRHFPLRQQGVGPSTTLNFICLYKCWFLMTSMAFSSFDKHIISIEGERVGKRKSDFSSRIYGGSCQYYQYHSS